MYPTSVYVVIRKRAKFEYYLPKAQKQGRDFLNFIEMSNKFGDLKKILNPKTATVRYRNITERKTGQN